MYFTYFLVERFFKRHAVDFGGKILLRFRFILKHCRPLVLSYASASPSPLFRV